MLVEHVSALVMHQKHSVTVTFQMGNWFKSSALLTENFTTSCEKSSLCLSLIILYFSRVIFNACHVSLGFSFGRNEANPSSQT